ncbi:hypothetical protein OBV_21240 [Oscillibacter valericigenes Sjm18-20]|nr:hypothetical protein OBV_21240 [Oscillibacter valericigenes Sjm18-20]
MQKTRFVRQNVFPVLAALIWGTGFVAQSVGADHVGPFTFNAARSAIAFVFLLGLCAVFRFRRKKDFDAQAKPRPNYRRDLLLGGLCCGLALTLGSNLQQKGIETTTSGKAGFITALYIIIVPILGMFLKKKVEKTVWVGVVLAVAGLYFLCIQQDFSISRGDFYIALCSLCLSIHILAIDYFTQRVDGVELSCAQFLVVTFLSSIGMFATERPSWEALRQCAGPILYVGIFSSGVAYTLQILAQRDSNPTVVSLLLSLESVFATLAGALLLGDRMSGREYFGCTLMLAAVVLAQIPVGEKKAAPDTEEERECEKTVPPQI